MAAQGERDTVASGGPTKHRVKVTVLVGALDVGGAELDILRNFPRLNREEFEVVVVSFGTRGPLGPEIERQGVPVIARADAEGAVRPAKRRRTREPFLWHWLLDAQESQRPPWWYRLYSGLVMTIPAYRRAAIKRVLRGEWRPPRRWGLSERWGLPRRQTRVGPPGWYELYSRCVMAIPADGRKAIKRFLRGAWIPPKWRAGIRRFLSGSWISPTWGAGIKRFLRGAWLPPTWGAGVKRFLGRAWRYRSWRDPLKRFVGVMTRRRSARVIARRIVQAIAIPFVWLRAQYQKSRPVVWVNQRIGTARYIAAVTFWIRDTLTSENTDVAHFFLPHSYVYGMFATALMPRPRPKTVMSRLSLNFYKRTHWLIAFLERNLLHHLVAVAIGNSTRILDELVQEGVPRGHVRLLYNGIDPEPLTRHADDRAKAREGLGIDPDAFVIVAVGNLHTYKGHRDLIEACSQVRDRLPAGWRLMIAGRDETGNRAKYEELVDTIGIADHVDLLGPCDNVPQLLRAADVFAHPSHHEGLPNAIIEAMAASLPVIGTTVGGLPEAIRTAGDSAETGWLVPPFEPESLAEAILEAAADTSRREAMGRRARERVEAQFSLTHSVATYEAIYRELLPDRF
jgi:glycosyltransferase involved in cell wall biosynthesis